MPKRGFVCDHTMPYHVGALKVACIRPKADTVFLAVVCLLREALLELEGLSFEEADNVFDSLAVWLLVCGGHWCGCNNQHASRGRIEPTVLKLKLGATTDFFHIQGLKLAATTDLFHIGGTSCNLPRFVVDVLATSRPYVP